MSTLHFVEINEKNISCTHSLLNKVFKLINLQELFPLISYGESILNNYPELLHEISYKEIVDACLADRILLLISPKYANQLTEGGTNVIYPKKGKCISEITNHVKKIYKQTAIHHNSNAREMLLNFGGVKAFMPFLYQLAETETKFQKDPIM